MGFIKNLGKTSKKQAESGNLDGKLQNCDQNEELEPFLTKNAQNLAKFC